MKYLFALLALLCLSTQAQAQTNNAAFVSQSVPTSMTTGQTYIVSVTMQNTGATTWNPWELYRLGSQNPQDNLTWGIGRVDPGPSIAPGQQYTFTFSVTAPSAPGTYNFQWRMLREGYEWFGGSSPNVQVAVTAPPPFDDAVFVSQSVASSMTSANTYNVSVTMRNTGNTTWTSGAGYKLGSQNPQDNVTWRNSNRVELTSAVAPGQQYTFNFPVIAPSPAGVHNFQWRMVHELVNWFGTPSTNVAVNVSGAAPPPTVIPAPPKSQTRTVVYEYEPATGLLAREIVEPSNPQLRLETARAYDDWGNLTSVTVSSPATGTAAIAPRVTNTYFDSRGQFPTVQLNPLDHGQTTDFDPRTGAPVGRTDPNQLRTQWQFDSFGRKTLELRPDGTQTRWDYAYCEGAVSCPALAKYVITETPYAVGGTAPNGPWVKRYFDMLEREVASQTLGFDGTSVVTTSTVHDDLGRVTQLSRPYFSTQAPVWNTFRYDVLGRVTSARDAAGRGSTLSYSGLQTIVRNALNQPRTISRDALGRVSTITDAASGVLRYDYDVFGNVYKTTDPAGNTVLMSYDLRGNKVQLSDPDMGAVSYAYDALGELVRQTDAKSQVTTLAYDKLGRLTSRNEPDLVSSWTYDTCTRGVGRLCSTAANNGYARSFGYDAHGRLSQTSTTVDTSYSESMSFDANGRPATQTYPNGFTVKFGYTALGYLKDIRNNATQALYWQADALDAAGVLVQQTFGNNVTTQQVLDPVTGRISRITAGAGSGVQNLSYTFDDAGNLLSRGDANQGLSESFVYDSLSRLKSSTVSSGGAGVVTQTYGYDSIGNLTSRSDLGSYTYGTLNRRPHGLTQIALSAGGRRTYAYDGNGNLTSEVQYDSANNVLAAKGRTATYTSFDMPQALASPSATLTFTYGTDHQRIKQVSPAGTTIYIHPDNSGGLTYEKLIKPDSTVEHRYFIGADQPVAIVKQVGTTTSVSYLHQDYLGSVTAVTNESGGVVERFAYEPFGKRRQPSGALDATGVLKGTRTNRGYTAAEHLDDLGLIHMNGRVYDPVAARFMSADPGVPHPEDPQSFNRYSYARNNPLAFVDPTGFSDQPPKVEVTAPKPQRTEQYMPGPGFGTRVTTTTDERDYPIKVEVVGTRLSTWWMSTAISWVTRTFGKILDFFEQGLRVESPSYDDTWVWMSRMPGDVSHGTPGVMDPHAPMYDSRYGLQPSYNAAVNVYNEVLKYELNALLVMTELGGIARGIAAAANLGSAARVASAAKAAPGINWGKQGKHLRTHNNYTEGRSVLTVNPAKLAGRAGTGQQVGKLPVGTPGSKERVNFGETIGDYIQDGVGPPQPTSIGIIHYAKDSIHIVPARP